jgi:hypothetical protein
LAQQPSIWDKVDFGLAVTQSPASAEKPETSTGFDSWMRKWRWTRPVLDALATLFWVYVALKLFVADVDQAVLGNLADYRFFFFLAVLCALVLWLRRPWPIVGGIAYVVLFPLVLACWRLPKALIKTRSPVVFLAAVNAVTSVIGDLKHSVVTTTLVAFTALAIALGHAEWLMAVAGGAMMVFVLQAVGRTVRFSLAKSRFLKVQQAAVRRTVDSGWLRSLTSPNADLLRPEIEKFTREQQTTFVQNLGNGILAHRVLYYWAYQLEKYRRSPASLLFNGLAYVWLVVRVLLGLAFVNLAIYHADQSAYSYDDAPSFLDFLRCSIAGLYGSEIAAVQPRSDLADALSVATFVLGIVIVGGLITALLLGVRATRNESEIRETIQEIKYEGARLHRYLEDAYDASLDEMMLRLAQLKFGLMGLVQFLSSRIPNDFEEPPPRS